MYKSISLQSSATPLINNVLMSWASIVGGAGSGGRDGSTAPLGLNNYRDTTGTAVTPTDTAFSDATKSVVDLDGGLVLPGDILEYTIVLDNMAAAVTGVVLSDTIPADTTYVPASITLNAGALSDALDADAGDFGVTTANAVTVNVGGFGNRRNGDDYLPGFRRRDRSDWRDDLESRGCR